MVSDLLNRSPSKLEESVKKWLLNQAYITQNKQGIVKFWFDYDLNYMITLKTYNEYCGQGWYIWIKSKKQYLSGTKNQNTEVEWEPNSGYQYSIKSYFVKPRSQYVTEVGRCRHARKNLLKTFKITEWTWRNWSDFAKPRPCFQLPYNRTSRSKSYHTEF